MHGREGEERKRRRHMWTEAVAAEKPPVFLPAATLAADSVQTSADSFLKQDGRKVRVGDCVLFQAGNAPPFIGLIRWFSTTKEGYFTLCVNWLYRPADIKLAKGILLEAAPNEVFYSFHRDIISAASLLHPCKVAFLHKGVDLPLGISCFVCRRVYDIANKCLWWLTDQDYINEHQEEVDLLLDKTRLEMHAAVQSGGCSPKQLNGSTSMRQLKSGSENSVTAHSSQIKGKKRDRGDQNMEPTKRERITKPDDSDSAICKFDKNTIKSEISKITEKGALASTDGVEKLVQLMQVDNNKKTDLTGRVLLADVIAATDKIDCLNKFVHIRGVPVLDEWLQEAHKGKTGDGSCPKESEKAVEELLLALLRALDKLPVNLNALQTSNIGRSVNHLRGHKNLEIQKKARNLVDRWKKRVDAEMKTNDSKSVGSGQAVTWPIKPGLSEVSHALNRRTGSGDLSMKSSVTQQFSCRDLAGKSVYADATVKSTNLTVGSGKFQSSLSAPVIISSKESLSKTYVNDVELPLVGAKGEQSSSSSHSQNNSQSCSSDHGKNVGSSVKENAKSSTAGWVNTSRTGGSSHHQRSSNGIVASNSSKSGSQIRNPTGDKVLRAGMDCERTVDMPVSDHISSYRLIVRLPNPGRSPARSTSGGSLEDPSPGSRASSPCVQDKHDHGDRKMIERTDYARNHIASDVNAESWQNNDVKEGLVASDGGDRSNIIPDEECRVAEKAGRSADISRTACLSSCNEKCEAKIRNSFSSMNALIESCAKYSEATTPLSGGDEIGMNLLASVATGEMSKSDLVSPSSSPEGSSMGDPFSGNNKVKSGILTGDNGCRNLGASIENADFDLRKHGMDNKRIFAQDEIQALDANVPGNDKAATPLHEDKPQQNGLIPDVKEDREDAHHNKENEMIGGLTNSKSEVRSPGDQNNKNISFRDKIAEEKTFTSEVCPKSSSDGVDCELSASGRNTEKVVVEESTSDHPLNKEIQGASSFTGERPHSFAENEKEVPERKFDDALTSSVADKVPYPNSVDETRSTKSDDSKNNCQDQIERNGSTILPPNIKANTGSVKPLIFASGVVSVEKKASLEKRDEGSHDIGKRLIIITREADTPAGMPIANGECREEIASSAEQDTGAKLDFDLNEGILGDDVNPSEPTVTSVSVFSPAIRMSTASNFVSLQVSTGSPATLTVAAPAKGAFVPPKNLLKSKGEPGWKGSAATSAFRPAEPRKVLDMLFNTPDMRSCETARAKNGRQTLEFDLNVLDERAIEDMASQSSAQTTGSESGVIGDYDALYQYAGALDLDLNRVDEGVDNRQFASTSHRLEVPLLSARAVAGGFSHGDASMLRDFDLNNGPAIDEVGVEPLSRSQNTKNSCSIPFVPPIAGYRVNNAELGSGWFPQGNSYPAVAIPSFLPDRGDQSYPIVAAAGAQRMLGSVMNTGTFGSDIYRSPVLTSSPAMAFLPTSTSISYSSFSFGSNFPLTSTFSAGSTSYVDSSGSSCFVPVPCQLVGPAGALSSPYVRPYVISVPEGGSESSRKWGRQGLDLNAGPLHTDEVKDDRLPSLSRQLQVANMQRFMEDQARLYQVAGGAMKRKEPDGGWEPERFTFKQPSWQ